MLSSTGMMFQVFAMVENNQIIVIFLAMMIHFLFSDHRKNAEDALQSLNGTTIGKQTVRLSWGRTPANKQVNRLDLLHNRIPHLVVCSYY
jgi:hypothetical protein